MPKNLRLSQADFALLKKQKNRKIYGVYFVLTIYSLPSSVTGPRAASVVAKKIVARAASRNAVERKFREIIRKNKNILDSGSAYVFGAKKGITEASYKELESDIQTLLSR